MGSKAARQSNPEQLCCHFPGGGHEMLRWRAPHPSQDSRPVILSETWSSGKWQISIEGALGGAFLDPQSSVMLWLNGRMVWLVFQVSRAALVLSLRLEGALALQVEPRGRGAAGTPCFGGWRAESWSQQARQECLATQGPSYRRDDHTAFHTSPYHTIPYHTIPH